MARIPACGPRGAGTPLKPPPTSSWTAAPPKPTGASPWHPAPVPFPRNASPDAPGAPRLLRSFSAGCPHLLHQPPTLPSPLAGSPPMLSSPRGPPPLQLPATGRMKVPGLRSPGDARRRTLPTVLPWGGNSTSPQAGGAPLPDPRPR